MNERLDYLLSAALDDELDSAEREELARLLPEHPEASERSAQLASVDEVVQSLAASSILASGSDRPRPSEAVDFESGLAAIRARLEQGHEGATDDAGRIDELAPRRQRSWSWMPPIVMAAAAAAIYLMVPQDSFDPFGFGEDESTDVRRLVDDPIALAVVFEIEDDADSVDLADGLSAEDFEIIETLELMEFLAARDEKGRG